MKIANEDQMAKELDSFYKTISKRGLAKLRNLNRGKVSIFTTEQALKYVTSLFRNL